MKLQRLQATSDSSLPAAIRVKITGQKENDSGVGEMEDSLRDLIRSIGCSIDLSSLDGVTFAFDYEQALRELDRGFEDEHELKKTDDRGVGVAMTASVIRNDRLLSQIVFNANTFFGMMSRGQEARAVQLLAHECAHVQANAEFDACFSDILKRQPLNMLDGLRREIILTCWDEYAACYLSASYGEDRGPDYETLLIDHLVDARERANQAISKYWNHRHWKVVREVAEIYKDPLKYAAYYLGNLAGRRTPTDISVQLEGMLAEHWFAPFFKRLSLMLETINLKRGSWQDFSDFESLADIFIDLLEDGGMVIHVREDDPKFCRVDLPESPELLRR